ncbi:MAG: beta-ketoacyl-[acyl-carrier-protein] synthase family protein [Pseudomonadota bacterium]|nr:beta-ketoacyl-[acyl-carrier-protein] synthase family protein [Pseudomonadota bacterium]
MTGPLLLQDCGVVTPLGRGKLATARSLFAGARDGITEREDLIPGRRVSVGAVAGDLPPPPTRQAHLDCRNNRLLQVALEEIGPAIEAAIDRYGRDRVAIILGTSTSGIESGEVALASFRQTGQWPAGFHYHKQEISGPSTFAAELLGITGPAYTVATACSSSAKVFGSARRLIRAGLVDAAIVGGVDTLCRMTLNGFDALELVSQHRCNPFSVNRDGLTIGEGAAVFLMTAEASPDANAAPIAFLGLGEASDAHHLTAPHPDGRGARDAMLLALADAGLGAEDIAYINLHGTATVLNDAMEARGVAAVFGAETPCSSTKGMTGHMLGATGGCEAAFLWLTLHPVFNRGVLPPHIWDKVHDPAFPRLNLVDVGTPLRHSSPTAMLSNSFGFGGSNVALIMGTS